MENKRVSLIVLVVIILFGVLCYQAYNHYQAFQQTMAEITENRSRLDEYANEEFPPTKENRRRLIEAFNAMEKKEAQLRKDMESYVETCKTLAQDSQGNPMPPDVFQKAVNDMTAKISSYAAEKKSKLGPDVAALGLNEYKTAPATQRNAPYLNYLLHASDTLVRHVIDSGSLNVKRLYCAPLQADVLDKFEKQKKEGSYFPMELEVGFTVRRSNTDIDPTKEETLSELPKVINRLVNDKKFFYVVTGISVKTPGNLPMLAPYRAVSDAVVDDPMQQTSSDDATAIEPSEVPVAKLITGNASQEVDVSLTLQVLYFMPDSKKKLNK